MMLVKFNDIKFVDLLIDGRVIMWFFIVIILLSFIIYIFNLVFISPASANKKEKDPELVKHRKEFDKQKSEVEQEISLILRVENDELKDKERKK